LSAIIAAAVAAVTLATVGSTLAFLVAKTDTIENIFTPSKVSCAVVEEFDGSKKEDVELKNTGNTNAFIRAAIVVTWKDASGNVYGAKAPVAGTDYTISIGDAWVKGGDDYYYYSKEVAPNATTADTTTEGMLIESCTPSRSITIGEVTYTLSVEILADAIQSRPDNAVSVWGATAKNGVITAVPTN
ncbi:MAG: hypothetical protein IJD13_09470, partial [Oscillospiraceae bacterium]|nr:hypothetical protein [Oscillospiraceae bacterium]